MYLTALYITPNLRALNDPGADLYIALDSEWRLSPPNFLRLYFFFFQYRLHQKNKRYWTCAIC